MSISTLLHRPPVYFGLAVLVQLALDYYFPIRPLIPFEWLSVSTFLFAGGALLGAFALSEFRRNDTPHDPYATAKQLVTTGVYRFSRNPMYLGLSLILAGLAWRLGSLGPWLMVPLFMALMEVAFIRPEERRLTTAFGDAYTQYRRQTRRWL